MPTCWHATANCCGAQMRRTKRSWPSRARISIEPRTEVQLRIQERIAIKGQVRLASSRLARLLLLQPTVALLPAEVAIVPVVLVPDSAPANELIALGVANRPELSASRSLVGASEARLRQAVLMPVLPRVEATYYAGGFGGGIDSTVSNFNMRGDATLMAVWELRNLGLGNHAINRERRIQVDEANIHVIEVQAQVADEVNSALQLARRARRHWRAPRRPWFRLSKCTASLI